MASPHVYDKAKYHYETIEELGLPEEHASNHTVFFLRWLLENDLMSEEFVEEAGDELAKFRAGKASAHQVYEWWDCCLVDDMLSDEGNAFAMHYFDFEDGEYLRDYMKELQGELPSEFHIEFNETNYQRMKKIIDRRFYEWRKSQKK